MRCRFPPSATSVVPARAVFVLASLSMATSFGLRPLAAQSSSEDPKALVKAAHERQHDFEQFRESRIPVEGQPYGGGCDAQIGRICIWFGGEDETDFPPEAPEVGMARRDLIQVLGKAAAHADDPWVTGQLVRYLAQAGDLDAAEQTARSCGITETWWCSALLGYVLDLKGSWLDSEAAFREAAASMPDDVRKKWLTPRYILDKSGTKAFEKAGKADPQAEWELFWRLSDPLYLVDGNDRLTEHFTRWVEATNDKDAENPQGMLWDDDMEEALVRYGRLIGYSRTQSPQNMMRGGRLMLRDTRQVTGHHPPGSRGYLFPGAFLESPSDIPPESWITAPREAHTWYAPPYAPDFRGLETQVGRFRRGDQMLVVGAYRPTDAPPPSSEKEKAPVWAPVADASMTGPVQAGLFLIPLDGGPAKEVEGTDAHGVFTLQAPPGKYVSSLEVFEPGAKRAWRARQGVHQVPIVPGLVAVSDLLILEENAPFPATLDEAIPHVRAGIRVRAGEHFTVVWEVYGLRVRDSAHVTLGFTKGRPGFLKRVGDFVGVLQPESPVAVTFEDTGTDAVQTVFRAVTIQLPELEPGTYTLHLKLELPGREAAIASRPIVVEP